MPEIGWKSYFVCHQTRFVFLPWKEKGLTLPKSLGSSLMQISGLYSVGVLRAGAVNMSSYCVAVTD